MGPRVARWGGECGSRGHPGVGMRIKGTHGEGTGRGMFVTGWECESWSHVRGVWVTRWERGFWGHTGRGGGAWVQESPVGGNAGPGDTRDGGGSVGHRVEHGSRDHPRVGMQILGEQGVESAGPQHSSAHPQSQASCLCFPSSSILYSPAMSTWGPAPPPHGALSPNSQHSVLSPTAAAAAPMGDQADWMSQLCPRLWDVPLHHLSIPGECGAHLTTLKTRVSRMAGWDGASMRKLSIIVALAGWLTSWRKAPLAGEHGWGVTGARHRSLKPRPFQPVSHKGP